MCEANLAGRLKALVHPGTVHLIVLSSDGNFVLVGVAEFVVEFVVNGVAVPALDFLDLVLFLSLSSSKSDGTSDKAEEASPSKGSSSSSSSPELSKAGSISYQQLSDSTSNCCPYQ